MGVGIRLKRILREKKMTIKELAEKADVPVHTLYSITRRDSENVDPVILEKLASVLDVTPGDLKRDGPYNKENWVSDMERKLACLGYYIYIDDPEHPPFIVTPHGPFRTSWEELKELDRQTDEYLDFYLMRMKERDDQQFAETLERVRQHAERQKKEESNGTKE